MSEPKIIELLQTVGMHISAGQISDFLIKDQEQFHAESGAVVRAGLASSPWQHLDSTGTRVNGKNEQCHVLCNPFSTAYCTLPSKDRLSLLRVLMGGADPTFRLNELALTLLPQLGVAQKWCQKLKLLLPHDQDWNEAKLDTLLDEHLPKLGEQLRKLIKDGEAEAAYRTQTAFPVVELLVCDDAPQFNWLTVELALCWIHEFRHYKKLIPHIAYHRQLLENFKESFWKLYRKLQTYQHHPHETDAHALRAEFEQLFGQTTSYEQLDERKALTLAKQEQLLVMLIHPEILLHNNPAELAARQRVRKRDVSLQARTKEGIGAWDTFQTKVRTAKKLGGIRINLRTVELGIGEQLIGVGPRLARIDGTALAHHLHGACDHGLDRDHPGKGQRQAGGHPRDDLFGFDHAAIGRLPTADQHLPMREDQPQQFGIDLRQNTLRLITAPGIQLAVLFPQFPQQFDLPAYPQQHQGFWHREEFLWHIGQHNRPIS